MTCELITGCSGSPHVSSADDGSMFASVIGSGRFAVKQGGNLAATLVDSTTVLIATGAGFMDGRYWRVTEAETVTIDAGEQGKNRIDLIGVRYAYDSGTGYETCALEVVKGTATTGTPSTPAYTDGDILSGAPSAYFPLYKVTITGITPAAPVAQFKTMGVSVSCPWPVGAVLHMTGGTDPNNVYPGTTWSKITGRFLLGSSSSYTLGSTGGASTVTLATANLPAHTHTVPAHAHGMNSHKHSVPAHSHGLNSHTHTVGGHTHDLNSHKHSVPAHSHGLNSHTHTYNKAASTSGSTSITKAQLPSGLSGTFESRPMLPDTGRYAVVGSTTGLFTVADATTTYWGPGASSREGKGYKITLDLGGTGAGHTHTVSTSSATSGAASGSTASSNAFNTGAASGSTASSAAFASGAATGNTAASAELTSGTATGNTANSSVLTSGAAGSGTAVNVMPPYRVVHMWERVS